MLENLWVLIFQISAPGLPLRPEIQFYPFQS